MSQDDLYCITQIYPDGKRHMRFANLSLTQADFYFRWLLTSERSSKPRLEVQEKALERFSKEQRALENPSEEN